MIITPNLRLRDIVCDFDALRFPLVESSVLCRLTSLKLLQLVPIEFNNVDAIQLDQLRFFEIRLPQAEEPMSLIPFLEILAVPNVEHFTINGMALTVTQEREIWPVLVSTHCEFPVRNFLIANSYLNYAQPQASTMPRMHSLTLYRDRFGYWPLNIHLEGLRGPTQQGGLLLPELKEIRLLGRDVAHLLPSMHRFISSRRGAITHLTLPPPEEVGESMLSDWKALRRLVPHFMVSAHTGHRVTFRCNSTHENGD
ncbi:hypothetical protein DL93DRAFT_1979065 [Clavulina sp. PMI_390]|nr:hypothetical protein DL93DRAFT_1979065 [Clavulina sp. PMI_390]